LTRISDLPIKRYTKKREVFTEEAIEKKSRLFQVMVGMGITLIEKQKVF
jgi:hypothetical protein